MALGAALVDRGHQIGKVKEPRRNSQGQTVYVDAEGPPFKCRLDISGPSGERRREERTATEVRPRLLCARKDIEGNVLSFSAFDKIRIVSRELGEDTWQVDGEPAPLRKRRTVLGWELNLTRTVEPAEQSTVTERV